MLSMSLCSELLDFFFFQNKMFALLPNFVLIFRLSFKLPFPPLSPNLNAVIYLFVYVLRIEVKMSDG